ncbi:MAG: purine-binding chemotaxis protein CheW [Melioribacteraceae bacterium]|nr:purine-binding chemotaxis protein CheW [Melioribacteraceae bacterium]
MKEEIENTVVEEELLQLVTFCLGEEEFGFDIFKVKEINKMMEMTKVPNSPPSVKGVINLRGTVTPVIDMRDKLGMIEKEYDKDTRIIVVESNEKNIGFIVDEVREVLRINHNIIESPPEMVSGINSEYITNIAKLDDRLLILIDIEKILGNM